MMRSLVLFVILALIAADATGQHGVHVCSRSVLQTNAQPAPEINVIQQNQRAVSCTYTDISQLAQLNSNVLFAYLAGEQNPFNCIYRNIIAYNTVHTADLFTNAKVNHIAANALSRANGYNGIVNNGIYGLISYLSVATQMNRFYPDEVSFDQTTWAKIRQVCSVLALNNNLRSETEVSFAILAELMNAASHNEVNYLPSIVDLASGLLQDLANDSYLGTSDLYAYYYSYYYVLDIYLRYAPENQLFIDQLVASPQLINNLSDVAINLNLNDDTYLFFDDLSRASVEAITRQAPFPEIQSHVEPALEAVIDTYDEYSHKWSISAIALIENGIPFEITEEELIANLEAQHLGNEYHFEDGLFIISTPLSFDEAAGLYEAAQTVKAQFFRMMEGDQSLPGDTNDTLYVYVYGDRQTYQDFNNLLFGVDYPNAGGVYIEQFSTFYTYERTAEDSDYTLEELFRHEYTHYLQGRYIVPGGWSESPFYDNNRLVWFEEGMAQFLSGSTNRNGIEGLNVVRDKINNLGQLQDLSTVFNSSYSSGNVNAYYLFGPMVWSDWYHNERNRFKQLIGYLQASDLAGFDAVIDHYKTSAVENNQYISHINAQLSDNTAWITPHTIAPTDEQVDYVSLQSLQNDLLSAASGLNILSAVELEANPVNRFVITATLTLSTAINNATAASIAFDEAVDDLLLNASSVSTVNNFDNSTGYFIDVQLGSSPSATVVISGHINDLCTPGLGDMEAESYGSYSILFAPDITPLKHRFRYRKKGTNNWIVLSANTNNHDVIVNLTDPIGYEYQISTECEAGAWSNYSASKYVYPCPDRSEIYAPWLSSDFTVHVADEILTNSEFRAPAKFELHAGDKISLLPGFKVEKGSLFVASNYNCRDRQ